MSRGGSPHSALKSIHSLKNSFSAASSYHVPIEHLHPETLGGLDLSIKRTKACSTSTLDDEKIGNKSHLLSSALSS